MEDGVRGSELGHGVSHSRRMSANVEPIMQLIYNGFQLSLSALCFDLCRKYGIGARHDAEG